MWDDDAQLIGVEEVDYGRMEDETGGSGGVEAVVRGGVRVEEEDGNVVEGVADMDVGVTNGTEVMLDSEPVD